ncbi:DNA replication licensing factor MCM2 [Brachionus plicatilis]|uniref:DNA replication licensing factor MCM2 n=1 Tax=Brachionus plicatilis TaxID=10195 RepID=A0A3M7R8H7_BRAPC|nr:DNA replication licensing factor MCM2 [Brachionus plicatilis]
MRKNFAKYLNYRRDHNELLLFLLKQLINDQLSYMKHKSKNQDINSVSIPEEDFVDRARQLKISNVKTFYDSELFKMMKYSYDSSKKQITQIFFIVGDFNSDSYRNKLFDQELKTLISKKKLTFCDKKTGMHLYSYTNVVHFSLIDHVISTISKIILLPTELIKSESKVSTCTLNFGMNKWQSLKKKSFQRL